MWHIVVLIAGLAVGLYAGKKRAKGKTWFEVVVDFSKDAWRNAVSVCKKLAYPFRREKPDCSDRPAIPVEPEVV